MMRIFLRFVALAGLCLWLGAATAASPERIPPGWKEIEIPAAHFKVLMPGNPKTSRQTIKTEIGNIPSTRYTVIDAANATYDVLFNEYPRTGVAKARPERLLESARDGLVYQTKGRILSEKPITVSAFPGRELEIMGLGDQHYRARVIWAGTRLYQILVVTPGKPRPEASVFFDSFQITGHP